MQFLKPGPSKLEATSSYFRRYTLEAPQLVCRVTSPVTCEHLATPVTDKRSTLKRLSSPLLVVR